MKTKVKALGPWGDSGFESSGSNESMLKITARSVPNAVEIIGDLMDPVIFNEV